MNPIVIVDNDRDDADFLVESLIDAGTNAGFLCFSSCAPALEYLKTTSDIPAIIISDINLPLVNGLSFKHSINEMDKMADRKIPFFFFSTHKDPGLVGEALRLSVQGYFQKPDNITDFDIVAKEIKCYLDTHPIKGAEIFT